MAAAKTRALYSTPISQRPPRTARDWLHLVTFNVLFLSLLLYSHTYQLLALPLALIPHPWAEIVFEGFNAHAKETFASALVFIVSWFAPTTIVLTAADDSVKLEELVRRDERGQIVGFKLAKQAVWMSNHQVRTRSEARRKRLGVLTTVTSPLGALGQMYCDWIYPWCLMSYATVSSGIIIVLKASLKWAPIVGPVSSLPRAVVHWYPLHGLVD